MINAKQFEPCTVQAIPDLNVKLMSRYLSYKCVKLFMLNVKQFKQQYISNQRQECGSAAA